MLKRKPYPYLLLLIAIFMFGCPDEPTEPPIPPGDTLQLVSLKVGTVTLSTVQPNENIPSDQPIVARFSVPMDTMDIRNKFYVETSDGTRVGADYFLIDEKKTISIIPQTDLASNSEYSAVLTDKLTGINKETFAGVKFDFSTPNEPLVLTDISIDGIPWNSILRNVNLSFKINLTFSHPVSKSYLENEIELIGNGKLLGLDIQQTSGDSTEFEITPDVNADYLSLHNFTIPGNLVSSDGHEFETYTNRFYTKLDSTLKFPLLSEEDLLTKVQEQTFKYFWDFGHPVSGLSRERNTSGDLVTSGGSGFGLMAILVGIERGFITRAEGINRLDKMVTFLGQADRFHGVWSHWLNGVNGNVIPFSTKDNGGDLVETSYLVMGLLTVRQYLDILDIDEKKIIDEINVLIDAVEWDWYRQNNQQVLYWHWSPQYGWEKNLRISGYNESLITYVLAASSSTHTIPASVYRQGWARNGGIVNGKDFYGINLPLGQDRGGPLFFAHYSFLGINPTNLSDTYADYWEQNKNHTLINREYCVRNPLNFIGYGPGCWGLTASDNHQGYSAHSPDHDLGVLTPTAALSSFPYTPAESMEALNHFYYFMGDRLWGEYGFYDAFNPTAGWTADSYLAIDQGPIIIMIENHRTGLL